MKPILVAVDAGSGNVAVRYNDDTGAVKTFLYRSLVVEGNLQTGAVESDTTWITAGEDGKDETYSVTYGGGRFVNTCDPHYQVSAAHRVLVMNALAQSGLGGREIILADTLPVNQYFHANRSINTARVEAKKASLRKPVRNYAGKYDMPVIVDVQVYPEAIPAFTSASMDAAYQPVPMFSNANMVMIVDIGRFTCDIAVVNKEYQIPQRRTSENGTRVMLERLHTLIQENEASLGLEETAEYSLEDIDMATRRGYLGSSLQGLEHLRTDITPLIQQAAEEFWQTINADIRETSRSLSGIDVVLFIGGGANYIGGKLPHIKSCISTGKVHHVVPDEPEKAIVRGVHLIMLSQAE